MQLQILVLNSVTTLTPIVTARSHSMAGRSGMFVWTVGLAWWSNQDSELSKSQKRNELTRNILRRKLHGFSNQTKPT